MTALGLTRVGSYIFTAAAVGGVLLTIADDVMPRSGSEADLGPNVAAVVGFYTLVLLAVIWCADAAIRVTFREVRGFFAKDP
jgi:hypothetical protein